MDWKRIVTRTISEVSSLSRSRGGIRSGFRVLLYHAVGSRLKHDTYGISIEPKLFERHMELLAGTEQQFRTSSFDNTEPADSTLQVAVTFDDGYKDNLYVAAPILLKYNIPFTVFVTSSFIRSGSQEYLAPAELRELSSLPGVAIGSHGATHTALAGCDDAALQRELTESRFDIENIIGREVSAIAYPHGSANLRVRDAARRAGYTLGGCSRFDINDKGRDPLLLCRCEIWATDSARVFRQKLSGAWDWYRWRSRDPATR
jgi:peptidoglycan/xylan/chitin deacetylase (PgdA/CDA1 family)